MKFDDFDEKMRIYEQSLDQIILPEIYIWQQDWMGAGLQN